MGKPLRDRRTPSELAARSQIIDFDDDLAAFPRLAEIVAADLETLDADRVPPDWRRAQVVGSLEFGFADAQRRLPALEGRISTELDVVCQRCLQPMRLPLELELRLVFADGAPAAPPGERYEVWELDDGLLTPIDVVEESLIMALPLAAAHENRVECSGPDLTEPEAREKVRPFADLKSRMSRNE